MRRPGEPRPDSSGGDHAKERLREFLEKRRPQDTPAPSPTPDKISEQTEQPPDDGGKKSGGDRAGGP